MANSYEIPIARATSLPTYDRSVCSLVRPELADTLADTAPVPYTLREFEQFLESTHTSEILSFLRSVSFYRHSYNLLTGSEEGKDTTTSLFGLEAYRFSTTRNIWRNIIENYIQQDSMYEINIADSLRRALLQSHDEFVHSADDGISGTCSLTATPPHPSVLQAAERSMLELLDNCFQQFVDSRSAPASDRDRYSPPPLSVDRLGSFDSCSIIEPMPRERSVSDSGCPIVAIGSDSGSSFDPSSSPTQRMVRGWREVVHRAANLIKVNSIEKLKELDDPNDKQSSVHEKLQTSSLFDERRSSPANSEYYRKGSLSTTFGKLKFFPTSQRKQSTVAGYAIR
jgi:hypothetical protein